MGKQKIIKKLSLLVVTIGITSDVLAGSFQLWSQDGGSIGNYHAGRAAIAEDASTNFYNPAGLIKIHNQQLLLGWTPMTTDVRFRGTVATNTLGTGPQPVTAQGGTFHFLPNMHYAAPLADDLVFGLSVMTPFAAETNYGLNTNARYAAALSSIYVVDAAPSLGFAYNNKISVGFGMDIEKAYGEFSFMTASTNPASATWNKNTGSSYGYGYHAGVLYQPSEQTRVGFNYLSQVIHHLHGGSSRFSGPLAHNGAGGLQYVNNLTINMALPPTTTLSVFHAINPIWDVMGTVIYTQWNLLNQITVQNMTGISGGASNNGITMIIPEHYRNTWNYSLGANYHVNEEWFIRTGIGYDQTPTNNQYRSLQFPDNNQMAIGLGAHFQATKTIGVDLDWTHSFVMNTHIHNLSQASGDQVTVTNGSIQNSADVYGLEMKWDIV
ncbi:MAG: ompP1 [Gammaproteobacteria bacterium]|jgi:long-chain fatty acid transport protein|nr:ompP1 [Gammaproteobacteria bacterium]MCE3238037.1 ompP1 [Gammaproteobacteria bacterium]